MYDGDDDDDDDDIKYIHWKIFFKFLAFTTLIVYVVGFWVGVVKDSKFLTLIMTALCITEASAFTNKAACCQCGVPQSEF